MSSFATADSYREPKLCARMEFEIGELRTWNGSLVQ
jgi:hypothetical protein